MLITGLQTLSLVSRSLQQKSTIHVDTVGCRLCSVPTPWSSSQSTWKFLHWVTSQYFCGRHVVFKVDLTYSSSHPSHHPPITPHQALQTGNILIDYVISLWKASPSPTHTDQGSVSRVSLLRGHRCHCILEICLKQTNRFWCSVWCPYSTIHCMFLRNISLCVCVCVGVHVCRYESMHVHVCGDQSEGNNNSRIIPQEP